MSPNAEAVITAVCILASIAVGLRAIHAVGPNPDRHAAIDAGLYAGIATAMAYVLQLPALTLILGLTAAGFAAWASELARRNRAR